ncbi:tetratricopeptide repeat protein [Mucilaginibacter gotjawali]|uniref:Tetratricopeptide (TPR) repeat protein n=2 Tax=Mucilaginibacter gotjawali TaxID=1550579 RepID=A0A839SGN9_9SPHI|nr:tetratricopeptide repeat protein [Mucilaginibacter gotjawali]MBB3056454.1 tetratricopeptide (TPR) repeat protein [Mucilaginibacter gotjawali]BAU55161.1 Tetratricopeptide repeat protein [Mucilaginibacter gotjawali]
MKKILLFVFFIMLNFCVMADASGGNLARDTNEVIKLNKQGFAGRLTNPEQTVNNAEKAMALAKSLDYKRGIGESYRVRGIGNYYLNQSQKAIDDYLTAIDYFKQANDLHSQAKVYNNIGILYRDNDYDDALNFFNQALPIALKLKDNHLVASIYLNIGDVYFRKKNFYQALNYDNQSNVIFAALKDSVNLVLCLQNKGVIYFNLHQYDKALGLLLSANQQAHQLDLNETIASINLTIAESYIAQEKYTEAEKAIQEGLVYANTVKDEKIEADFKYTSYQLEAKRKNYELALNYLQSIYHKDSVSFKQNSSTQITLLREQAKQQARIKENEILLQRQKYDRVRFWGVTVVAGLLLVLVGLLVSNVKRKAKTNLQLTALNAEVSRQKDNLDRINHHLEEIIDERTKDLQVKNKKLSEYSSYLSHQIRGPIATLKGLLNLEKEGLVDQRECIRMMNKSVSEIDDKIIEMSDMLHDPGRAGF